MEQIKKQVNQTAIYILQDLLEKAISGDIQDIAIVGTFSTAETFNVFDCDYRPVSVLGELSLIERDIVDICTNTRRQPAWEYCE